MNFIFVEFETYAKSENVKSRWIKYEARFEDRSRKNNKNQKLIKEE